MKTINVTLEINPDEIRHFEGVLNTRYEVISFKILADTQDLHDTSESFRKLVKKVKQAQWERDTFINENN